MRETKLTEDDYLLLFPLVRPIEIVAEFGSKSHCCSQIRNKYRKLKFETQARALRALKREIISQKPYSIPVEIWKKQMLGELEEKKQEAIAKVWARLQDREALYA